MNATESTEYRDELRKKLKLLQNKRMSKHAKEVFIQKVTSKDDTKDNPPPNEYIEVDVNQIQ